MAATPYQPNPIDTSQVSLDGLEVLVETLSRNAHEIWARQRLRDGWTYGANRDDARKQHPDLIPYDDLTEGEKVYDREMVKEALKGALALGYRILR